MPILENYRHYFDIDPDYFPAVNEAVINSKPDMWKKFFPHETFVKLLKNTVSVLDRKQKLSIWVEGAYGTGKSHAVLTEKKLLDASEEDTREYFERYHLDMDLYKNLQRIKNSGKILTVHRYGSSNIYGDNDLVLAIQESVEKAMAAAGIENKGKDSLRESVIRYLSDSENKQSFNIQACSLSFLYCSKRVRWWIEFMDLRLQGAMGAKSKIHHLHYTGDYPMQRQ